uniref:Major facilitator superfamily (MFS) profile domain-containing protein n=1 Tax=Lygus hesperus TaxID=30085 RepID=A0A0K8SX32_LYGHE
MSGREKLIIDSMGEVGPFQVKIFLLISLLKFPTAWTLLGMIFMGAPVPFTCTDSTEQCVDSKGQECHHWTYNRTVFRETIATEWDLVCDRKHLTNLAQTTYMIGILFGTILFSMASDKWGRKKPLILTGVLQLVTGVTSSIVPWYWGFIALRFVQALCVGGNMTISFVICMEVLNGSWRTIMATLTHIPFNIGSIIMSVIAYYTREWRLFQFIVSLPIGIIIFYWWLIPESPRWLVAVGKDKEALALLQKIAKINHRTVPEKIPEKVGKEIITENKAGFIDLFRTPNMRMKTLIVWANWTNIGLCFFGLEQYLSHSGGDIFINVAASSAFMIPGVLASIYTMDRFGRKLTLFGGQILAAVSCLIILVLPQSLPHLDWYRVCFATVGVTGTAVGFTTLYLYSSELFPTVVRNTGLGSGSMCARIGSMIAPFVASLAQVISPQVPAAFFGASSLTSALLCLLLPETVRTTLPVTLEDGENFGKKNKEVNANGTTNSGYVEEYPMES